jgi:hypothetical protein
MLPEPRPIRYRRKPLGTVRPIPLAKLDLSAAPHPDWLRGLPMPCEQPWCLCAHFVVGEA